MEKILTIAIPVYNMEKYLQRCLNSVVESKNIEMLDIIVVNDGSKDCSLEIAREYEKKYPSSVRVIDKKNGGWGSAINMSIALAKGKYYKQLDSDDCYNTNELDALVELMMNKEADVFITSVTEICDGTIIKQNSFTHLLGYGMITISQYMKRSGHSTPASIHCIAYRTEMLQNNQFKVSECFYADQDFKTLPLIYSKSLYITDYNVYNYYYGREGQSVSVIGYRKHFKDYLNVCRNQIDFYEQQKSTLDLDCIKLLKNKLYDHIKWGYELMLSPRYCLNEPGAYDAIIDFDSYVKAISAEIYKYTNSIRTMKVIPYVAIWRIFKINILRFTVNAQL